MYAIEFETIIRNGIMVVPEQYARLKNTRARVVILVENSESDQEVRALSNHSAGTIEEWTDPEEDEVWT
ncbi:MAG: hypothetical protein ABGX87_16915 [Alcanivorax sp.]|uniref:hypothetical protein n=1 Tax=Alloalcanivorax marinus TaxID=1177169 RepID=UPI00195A8061|nr:hypothetical protein [Alloalcanivorax marinus]MBM7333646.1 hypothetical protein [Alloalcanivorax marinus]